MVGQRLKRFRERLGTERTKVLVDVSKALAIASFIGAGTVLRTSFLSATILLVGGSLLLTLAVALTEPPR
jgi:hypothetical protein